MLAPLVVLGLEQLIKEDVYKRQVSKLNEAAEMMETAELTGVLEQGKAGKPDETAEPVSYTHLDVYKRQVQRSSVPSPLEKIPRSEREVWS